jgi:hypothetical protein
MNVGGAGGYEPVNNRRPTPQTVIDIASARAASAHSKSRTISIDFASAMRGHRRKSTGASTSFLSPGI